jgi:hypothetical protein
LKNEEDIQKFPNIYDIPKLNQEVIKNSNRSITSNEIETLIKKLLTKKSPGLHGLFYQTCKEKLTPIFLKLFCKLQKKGILSNILQSQYYPNTKAR